MSNGAGVGKKRTPSLKEERTDQGSRERKPTHARTFDALINKDTEAHLDGPQQAAIAELPRLLCRFVLLLMMTKGKEKRENGTRFYVPQPSGASGLEIR